jgi:hypothetical protein
VIHFTDLRHDAYHRSLPASAAVAARRKRCSKAELDNPETNTPVATFTETCHDDGTATMKVVLKSPITISGTERLAIYSTIKNKNEEVIFVIAKNGASTEIHDFEGTSSLCCLADKTLTRSPGGPLGTLLVVLGKGTIHEEHY